MSKRVEDYFKNNREAFYEKEPPAYVWDNVEKNLFAQPKPKNKFIGWGWVSGIAASILVVCTVAILWKSYDKIPEATGDSPPIAGQREYIRLISSKREELEEIKTSNPGMYADFVKDIDELQAEYRELKNKLNQQPDQEAIRMDMIMNLQAQMDALNQQLQVIEKIKNGNHETQGI